MVFGLLDPQVIDNYAHAGGFVGGYLDVQQIMNPLSRERGDHLIIAVDLYRFFFHPYSFIAIMPECQIRSRHLCLFQFIR